MDRGRQAVKTFVETNPNTRMHSSRMHTVRCSGCLSCHACSPCHTWPSCHSHLLATHAPCHTCPPATHTPCHTHPCHTHPMPHIPPCHTFHPAMHVSLTKYHSKVPATCQKFWDKKAKATTGVTLHESPITTKGSSWDFMSFDHLKLPKSLISYCVWLPAVFI